LVRLAVRFLLYCCISLSLFIDHDKPSSVLALSLPYVMRRLTTVDPHPQILFQFKDKKFER
jgi:hypothetical protein